jgi:hypothetical protein
MFNLELSTYYRTSPMAPERPKQFLLGVLVIVLLLVGARAWRSTSDAAGVVSREGKGSGGGPRRAPAAAEAPDVHLDALAADRRALAESQRNLFRFKPKPPPPPPAAAAAPVVALPPPPPSGPPPPPPLPAIPLKFIGIVETAGKSQRLAVLSDGRGGVPFSGKEGDIIEGRYRILRIGSESIEMAYLDGRGRQTIRLSGS